MDDEMVPVGHPDRQRQQDERNREMTRLVQLLRDSPPTADWLDELRFRELMLMLPPTRWQVFKARLRYRLAAVRAWVKR